jgi:rubrerythrin
MTGFIQNACTINQARFSPGPGAAGNDDDLKAVRAALNFEARGRDFYASLRDASRDEREKAFFDLLSGVERDHYLSLLEAEEFLVDPAAWYRKKDQSGWLDGGA